MTVYPSSIELARLYERISARGTRYLLGRLGAARGIVLPGDPTDDGLATWRLMVQEQTERPDRPRTTAGPAPHRCPPSTRHRRPTALSRADPVPLDDPLDDLWPNGPSNGGVA